MKLTAYAAQFNQLKMNQFKNLLMVFLLINIGSGCLKKQNLEDSQLGPAIDPSLIQSEMEIGTGEFNPLTVKPLEFSSIKATKTFEDSQTIPLFEQSLFVDTIENTNEKLTLNLNYSKKDLLNDQNSFSGLRVPLDFTKTQNNLEIAQNRQLQINATTQPFYLYRAFGYMTYFACRESNVSCHSFKFTDFQIKLSPEMADPSYCTNTLNCVIPTRKIEFDLIDHNQIQSDGKATRTHYSFFVAKTLPFFAKVLEYCARGLTEYNNKMVLTEDCISLTGFNVGQSQ